MHSKKFQNLDEDKDLKKSTSEFPEKRIAIDAQPNAVVQHDQVDTSMSLSAVRPDVAVEPDALTPKAPDSLSEANLSVIKTKGAQPRPSDLFCLESQCVTLIIDEQKVCYAVVDGGNNASVLRVGSGLLNALVSRCMLNSNRPATKRSVAEFNEALEGEALAYADTKTVSRRVAKLSDGTVVVALHDEANTQVWIRPNDVQIVRSGSDVYFYQAPTASALVMPAVYGDWKLLKKYVNMDHAEFILYIAWISYTLATPKAPGSVFPILLLVGGMGTGKSWISKVALRLIDPSVMGVQRIPKNSQDLAIATQSSHAVAYDNLRELLPDMSDALCTAATGGTVSTRKLYSNDELHVLKLHSALILNGIYNFAHQPDLAQRCVPMRLEPMPETQRHSEADMLVQFEADLPIIERGIFDLIAKVLVHLPSAQVTQPQRMMAFAQWLAAMEMALNIKGTPFQNQYASILDECQLDALRANLLGAAVIDFVDGLKDGQWSGTPSDLLLALNVHTGHGLHRPRGWPDNEIAMSKRLLPLQAALMTQGIVLETRRGKERLFVISKKA